ncbi:COG1470 family protein [Streptomyces kronopolitis]|uniref:COG1470 family protein n=1 Tax=Streptomyces kronopolitis TaxID=1612435 RepID=UPI00368BA180
MLRTELIVPEGQVQPGDSLTADLRVWNESPVVDAYRITLLGPPTTWGEPSLGHVPVYPGSHETVTIPITVPSSGDLPPGPLVFAVRTVSTEDPARVDVAEGVLHIGEFQDAEVQLTRERLSGRLFGSNLIILRNTGNTPLRVRLRAAAKDKKAPIALQVRRSRVVLHTSERARVAIVLRAFRPIIVGEPAPWGVDVDIELDSGEVRTDSFTYLQRPFLTKRALKIATMLAALGIAAVAVWISPLGGGTPKLKTESIKGATQEQQVKAQEVKAAAQKAKGKKEEEKKEQEQKKAAEKKKAEDEALKKKPLQQSLYVPVGKNVDTYMVGKGYRLMLTAVQLTAAGPGDATLLLTAGKQVLATTTLDKASEFKLNEPVKVLQEQPLQLIINCPVPHSSASRPPDERLTPSTCTATALLTGELIPLQGPYSKDNSTPEKTGEGKKQ